MFSLPCSVISFLLRCLLYVPNLPRLRYLTFPAHSIPYLPNHQITCLIITPSPSTIKITTQTPSTTSQTFLSIHDSDPSQGLPQAENNQNKQTMTLQYQASILNNQPISDQPSRLRGGGNGGAMAVLGWTVCLQCCECCYERPCCSND